MDRWNVPAQLKAKMRDVAKQFRKEPTPGEDLLWMALRRKQLHGRKFRRQQPIGPFIVDFYCAAERLVIEVDGPIHEARQAADRQRQELIESLGLRFIRIPTLQVETNINAALELIGNCFPDRHL